MNTPLFVISIIYGIMGVVYLLIAIRGILKRNSIRIFDLVQLMFAFVYGFIPFLLYWQEASGERNLKFYDYSSAGIIRIAFMMFFSVLAYFIMTLAYKSTPLNVRNERSYDSLSYSQQQGISKHLLVSAVIALVIGWFSLFLWTRAYGSISNFILNASFIRSGRGSVNNQYAFMKQLVRIMPLSLYALLSAYCYEKPKSFKKILYILLIGVSTLGNYLYFLASDSRVTIISLGLAVLVIFLRHRKQKKIGWYLFLAAVISVALLQATMLADVYTRYVRYGIWDSNSDGIISSLAKEFSFILSTDMKVMKAWFDGRLHIQILNDLLNAVTSWIPSRFVPFSVPGTLWNYNTNLYGAVGNGTQPSALVSTGLYELGSIGVIIYPFIFGRVIGYTDKKLHRRSSSMYTDVYYGLCASLFAQTVSHNQISSVALSLFPAFMFFLITKLVDNIFIDDRKHVMGTTTTKKLNKSF